MESKCSKNINLRKQKWESIAVSISGNSSKTDQYKKAYANIRSTTVKKLNHNRAEISKTGSGIPKLLQLTDLEQKVSDIICVAQPINNVSDSNPTSICDQSQVDINTPDFFSGPSISGNSTTIFEDTVPPYKKQKKNINTDKLLDAQIASIELDNIQGSHLNSLKCIKKLEKLIQANPDNSLFQQALEKHTKNFGETLKILFN